MNTFTNTGGWNRSDIFCTRPVGDASREASSSEICAFQSSCFFILLRPLPDFSFTICFARAALVVLAAKTPGPLRQILDRDQESLLGVWQGSGSGKNESCCMRENVIAAAPPWEARMKWKHVSSLGLFGHMPIAPAFRDRGCMNHVSEISDHKDLDGSWTRQALTRNRRSW